MLIKLLQSFCEDVGLPSAPALSVSPKRRRLLTETELVSSSYDAVEDVLQLLQLLYAISRDAQLENDVKGKQEVQFNSYLVVQSFQICRKIVYIVLCLINLVLFHVN